MSRVKITEHKAKQLILGGAYKGISIRVGEPFSAPKKGKFVVKVDQGIKKRFKQGLVALDKSGRAIMPATLPWRKKGFTRFIAEPFFPHKNEEEQYLSLERVRDGVQFLFSKDGGVDIEKNPEAVQAFTVPFSHSLPEVADETGIPLAFLETLSEAFETHFFAFLEINPLIIRGDKAHLLDAAALVDSAGASFVRNSWTEDDIVEARANHIAEKNVKALAETTPSSLSLKVLNPQGSIFFLLSGGGGSIVIADEAELKGMGKKIGNYGEYSGGPTREETHLYTREVLGLLLASRAKKKALVIAGGVANFTDIKSTFAGIIDALKESEEKLRKIGVRVYVRRGGPNERAGLEHMRTYLKAAGLLGAVYGSDDLITSAVDDALQFIA